MKYGWLVKENVRLIHHLKATPENVETTILKKFDHFIVPLGKWHQIINTSEVSNSYY